MMEEGLTCLSMHQPWASLLVYGIKRIEGRSWDSQHRGRLWIHSTAQEPDPAEIAELHAFYSQVHGMDEHMPTFPPAYPKSALLGCVEVVDVLPRAAVEEWPGLPESCRLEALSPFCFLCEKPKRLVVPQPLKGQHKLWQLPRAVLKVALQGLRDPPGLRPFAWRDFGDPRVMLAPAPPPPSPSSSPAAAAAAASKQGNPGKENVSAGAAGREQQASGGKGKGQGSRPASGAGQPTDGGGVGGSDEGGGGFGGLDAAEVERRLRAVRKKLRQVSELEAVQRSGGALAPEQAAKLERAEDWRRELAELEAAAAAAGTDGA